MIEAGIQVGPLSVMTIDASPPRETIFWATNDASARNAGFRIRTAPLIAALVRRGVPVRTIDPPELVARFAEIAVSARLVVMSKPTDSISYLCLRALLDAGTDVAIDLYDNYFSWSPAIEQRDLHWTWLRNLGIVSLVITSTAYLEGVVRSLHDVPLLLAADPLPAVPLSASDRARVERKWPLRDSLEVLWFGISGNPYHRAGLADLIDWVPLLVALRDRLGSVLEVHLTICTNRHPGLEATLGAMRREGIDVQYVEWSDAGCATLQAASHVVLLPTNLTGFSLSKTHNRCSDAVYRRCLVLASPRGPYREIGGAVFVELAPLVACLRKAVLDGEVVDAALRTSREALPQDVDVEATAERLLQAFGRLPGSSRSPPVDDSPRLLIVARSRVDTVKFSRRLGYLSAGFPAGATRANFDFSMVFEGEAGTPALAWIRMSTGALQATCGVAARAADAGRLDVIEGTRQLVCRSGGWRLVLDIESRVCAIVACPDAQLREAVDRARLLRPASPHELTRWYDAMVALLVQTLQRLGFTRLEFIADESGGWRAFAEHADPRLLAIERRLRDLWQRHAGHEEDWGASTGVPAIARPADAVAGVDQDAASR